MLMITSASQRNSTSDTHTPSEPQRSQTMNTVLIARMRAYQNIYWTARQKPLSLPADRLTNFYTPISTAEPCKMSRVKLGKFSRAKIFDQGPVKIRAGTLPHSTNAPRVFILAAETDFAFLKHMSQTSSTYILPFYDGSLDRKYDHHGILLTTLSFHWLVDLKLEKIVSQSINLSRESPFSQSIIIYLKFN